MTQIIVGGKTDIAVRRCRSNKLLRKSMFLNAIGVAVDKENTVMYKSQYYVKGSSIDQIF